MKLAMKLGFYKRCFLTPHPTPPPVLKLQKRTGRVLQISLVPLVPLWALLRYWTCLNCSTWLDWSHFFFFFFFGEKKNLKVRC